MFKSIEIKQFRSCRNVKLTELHELLLLIGRNGAGKTNILKAIDWTCRFATNDVTKKDGTRRNDSEDGEVALTFDFEGKQYCYELKKETILEKGDAWREKTKLIEKLYVCQGKKKSLEMQRDGTQVKLLATPEHVELSLEISDQISVLTALSVFLPDGHPSRVTAEVTLRFLAGVRYYPLHNYDETADEQYVLHSRYAKWKSENSKENNAVTYLLYRILQLHLERPETFDELNSLMGENGLGLVEEIKVTQHSMGKMNEPDADAFYFISFAAGANRRLFINDLSFGTKRVLFLLVSLLYDASPVFLLEQPEDGIHIGLVEKLQSIIQSYASRSQFLIASHSTTILNQVTPDEVYFVASRNGFTEARSLSPIELEAAADFLRQHGPLSDFLESIFEA